MDYTAVEIRARTQPRIFQRVDGAEKNDYFAHNACFPLPIKALGMVILLFQDCPCHDYAMTIPIRSRQLHLGATWPHESARSVFPMTRLPIVI